ncbi:hypothetical protein QQS21_005963 [Conoideocrella luteorostrata]|uniref:Peptidase S8/S53 domain-containing protein n=1 Tax=Conoideocrella luteorostrata TaxID=1105319 RepID=A0AAJ0CNL4_9HYPO|nr:hypothetical protein QQS21_005963 [Conoideocrella luteorostrata]
MMENLVRETYEKASYTAESSEALAGKLEDEICSQVDLSHLSGLLVNRFVRPLRFLIEWIKDPDVILSENELERLGFIGETIDSCADIAARMEAFLTAETTKKSAVVDVSNDKLLLTRLEADLLSQSNILNLAQHIAVCRLNKTKPAATEQTSLILGKLDATCKWLLDSEVFPGENAYSSSSRATFELEEAKQTPSKGTSYKLICEHAGFPIVHHRTLEVKFHCYCTHYRHDAELTFTASSEGCIPVEEPSPGSDMVWTMFLKKESAQVSLHYMSLANFIENMRFIHARTIMINPALENAQAVSETVKISAGSLSVLRTKLHVHGPHEVEFNFGKRLIVREPKYIKILHYATASRASVLSLSPSPSEPIFQDECNFWVFLSDRSPASWEPGNKPLESYSIRGTEAAVLNYYQDIHEISNTDVVSDFIAPEFHGSARARFSLVHIVHSKNNHYRLIMTRDRSPRSLCFDLESSIFDDTLNMTQVLESQPIRTADISDSGKIDVARPSWGELVSIRSTVQAAARYVREGGTAAPRSDPSLATEQWLEENIDQLKLVIRAKSPHETAGNHKRVRIAIIDTGLVPDHGMKEKVVYRNFVTKEYQTETRKSVRHPTTDHKMNSASQGLQDTSQGQHGTVSADIILRVYDYAELYIARVFERNSASKDKEPFFMAEAIHWAVKEKVDIINISAGFKECPDALREAIHAAYASHTLIFAAASNWGNIDLVAYPARIRDQVFCIFATNSLQRLAEYNPEPRKHADNFAIVGDGIQVGGRIGEGTSAATAVTTGLAALILDFVRQNDITDGSTERRLKTKAGMTAVFRHLVMAQGSYDCITPRKLLMGQRYDRHKRAELRNCVKSELLRALSNIE